MSVTGTINQELAADLTLKDDQICLVMEDGQVVPITPALLLQYVTWLRNEHSSLRAMTGAYYARMRVLDLYLERCKVLMTAEQWAVVHS